MDVDGTPINMNNIPSAMSVVLNIFPNGNATVSNPALAAPPVEMMSVKVVLPDDFKTQVRIAAQASILFIL